MHNHEYPWYALRVRHRNETISSVFLRSQGFVVYNPTCAAKRQWSDRIKRLDVPLFPGYIFCQMLPSQRVVVCGAPGVVQIVSVGKVPAPVDPSEMEGILRSVEYGFRAEPAAMPQPKDRVLIQSGPFRGLDGVVLGNTKRKTIILSLSLLQRAIAVEVDETDVSKLKPLRRSAAAGN